MNRISKRSGGKCRAKAAASFASRKNHKGVLQNAKQKTEVGNIALDGGQFVMAAGHARKEPVAGVDRMRPWGVSRCIVVGSSVDGRAVAREVTTPSLPAG